MDEMQELLAQAGNDSNFVKLLNACKTDKAARFNLNGLFETQKYYLVAALAKQSKRTLAILLIANLPCKLGRRA